MQNITMKHFLINKCNVELTKESLTSIITSKIDACDREVAYICIWYPVYYMTLVVIIIIIIINFVCS